MPWRGRGSEVAEGQCGVLSERSLRELKVTRAFVRNQVACRPLGRAHPLGLHHDHWPAVPRTAAVGGLEHAGPAALLGGLTATERLGMKNWARDEVTVLVDQDLSFDPVDGVRYFRTRRSLSAMRHPTQSPRSCRIEPAVLLFAAHEPSTRTALGAISATVQQRLTTPAKLLEWTRTLRPLRRAAAIRDLLADVAGGSQSLAEIDVLRLCRAWGLAPPRRQKRRRDRSGRCRFTDCEWDLPGRPGAGAGDRRRLPHRRRRTTPRTSGATGG